METIERALERDRFFTADEAKTFGLIDEVVTSRPSPKVSAAA
jgi:ATP-dependent Clp protease, protease subunit